MLAGSRPVVQELALPPEAAGCELAVGTSRGRVVGRCREPSGRPLSVLWVADAAGRPLAETRILRAPVASEIALVTAIAGDLAVGSGGLPAGSILSMHPMYWRLPALLARG